MLNKEERVYQKDMITIYGGISDCTLKNCDRCSDEQIEECYSIASSNCTSEFAKSNNYGGYSSEEEFWDNL